MMFTCVSTSVLIHLLFIFPSNTHILLFLLGVMNAARSLIGVFRELNPEMLRKKDRVRLL